MTTPLALAPSRRLVTLASPTDIAGFRREARQLFVQQIPPEQVDWRTAATPPDGGTEDLWSSADMASAHAPDTSTDTPDSAPPELSEVRMPKGFVALCDTVALHRDPTRFALLYRLMWRLGHEPQLRHDPLDADRMRAHAMARAVERDIHKMRAFVRFRPMGDGRHVAWFEPQHHIVEANAPFFMRRFTQMRWAILTPDRCVEWDGQALHFGPGAQAHAAPKADAGEALWLTYYEHIFNPARLKLATMAREMPRRYWHNLPEATLIRTLADEAASRAGAMVAAEPTAPRHIRPIDMPRRAASLHVPSPGLSTAEGEAAPAVWPRAHSLAELRDLTQACRNCPIGAGATQSVCGEGPMKPAVMMVGEQAGDQEDLAGRPFVGPAGRLLDKAMAEIGWQRDTVYVSNAVKHFKYELRGKRRMHKSPGQREVEACGHWLEQEIAMVQPQRLVALGATAARALLGRPVAILREHGQWLSGREDGRPVLVTWHPSALLRMPEEERAASYARWLADLRQALRGAPARP